MNRDFNVSKYLLGGLPPPPPVGIGRVVMDGEMRGSNKRRCGSPEKEILQAIKSGANSISEICKATDRPKATVQNNLPRMVEKGLIVKICEAEGVNPARYRLATTTGL